MTCLENAKTDVHSKTRHQAFGPQTIHVHLQGFKPGNLTLLGSLLDHDRDRFKPR
jgi:hypothetical protein